jgi:hypothetical protein
MQHDTETGTASKSLCSIKSLKMDKVQKQLCQWFTYYRHIYKSELI